MRVCPVCHRSLAEGATVCERPDCRYAVAAPRRTAKRPPPPPRHVQLEARPAHGGRDAPPASGAGAIRSRWFAAAGLATLLIVLGGAAWFFVAFDRRRSAEQQAVAVRPPDGAPTPPGATAQNAGSPADEPAPEIVSNRDRKTDAAKELPGKSPDQPPAALGQAAGDPEATLGLMATRPQPPLGQVADEPAKLSEPSAPPLALPAPPPPATFAERTKPKTVELLEQYGGAAESQAAVEEGLDWPARHQAYDGHWGADCVGAAPTSQCERAHCCDRAGQPFEAAQTGLAVLAFQAGGHYNFNGQKYSDNVERGLRWLLERQSTSFTDPPSPRAAPQGGWIVGSQNPSAALIVAGNAPFQQYFMYEHAIATLALCEACAVAIA